MSTLPFEQDSVLQHVARTILVCPCAEGAARDFSQLDEASQNQVWSDLTGELDEEAPSMIAASLEALEREIDKLPEGNQRASIDLARSEFGNYVNDFKFRLKFLRAEKFDAERAARRMAIHFELKLDLFGKEKMGREIELADLNEDDLYSLELGYFQFLKDPDRSGRRILFYYQALSNCYRNRENILRVVWYITNLLSQDESVQQLGLVNIVYNVGGFPEGGMDYEKSRRLAQVFRGIPVRFDSFFVCLDATPWLTVVQTFSVIVDAFLRVRMRAIVGSHTECCYKLMALGIPFFSMPVTENSELLTDFHSHFFQYHLERENSNKQTWLLEAAMDEDMPNIVESD